MLRQLKRIWSKEQFHPEFFGIFLNPFYFARKGLYQHISSLSGGVSGDVLDVGCGSKPYRDLFTVRSYVGLEIDSDGTRSRSSADVFYDGERFPFEDGVFDAVLTNQVFEHVFSPSAFLSEINRVLKPDGVLLLTVPFVWDEHEQPHDFARYSSFGLKHCIEAGGFRVIEQRKSMSGIRAVFQILQVYLHKSCCSGNLYRDAVVILLFFAPLNILGELLGFLLPDNDDLYLDNIVLARKHPNV